MPMASRGTAPSHLAAGLLACLVLPALALGACPAEPPEQLHGPALDAGSARQALRPLYAYVPAAGFAYHDAHGRLTGVTIELLRDFTAHASTRLGRPVEPCWVEYTDWRAFYAAVSGGSGGVLGVGNVTITEARRAELAFSPPYLHNTAVLVTHEAIPELPAMDAIGSHFAGLTALPFAGTLHATRLEAIAARWMPGMASREVMSNDALIDHLAEGGHFGYVDAYNFWRARNAGKPLRRHAVGDDGDEAFGVILPLESDWLPALEDFFRADGGYIGGERYRAHLRTHLGPALAELLSRD